MAEDWTEQRDREHEEFLEREAALRQSPEWRAVGRIIKHMWIIAVLLPVALGLLFAVLK